MLSKEANELIAKTGPGTPCGDLMRRYGHPVALSDELPTGGAPLPLRILSEDLVANDFQHLPQDISGGGMARNRPPLGTRLM